MQLKVPINPLIESRSYVKEINKDSAVMNVENVHFVSRSPESLRWPIAMAWRPLTSSQKLLGQYLPKLVCSTCRGRRPEIVNFMTPKEM